MTAGIVLAAGAGRRFGGPKQLAHVGGEPLVRRACRTALAAALDPVIVVLGAHADAVAPAIADLPVRVVHNAAWAEGLASSIRAGVAAAAADPSIDAIAILLADQPRVTAAHVRALCAARRAGGGVAATRHGDVLGAPAVFDRAWFAALAALTGDRGARDAITRCPAPQEIPLPAAALDVDTPADLPAPR